MMDTAIQYRKMKPGDEQNVHSFIARVFNHFVAPDFTREGIEEFLNYIQPEALVRHIETDHFVIIAELGSEIIGVVAVRDFNHIALFFVDRRHQRRGIGKALLRKALAMCKDREPEPMQITVNASPNSADAYRKLHFEPTDREQCVNGIRFVPMVLRLE